MNHQEDTSQNVYILGFCSLEDFGVCLGQLAEMRRPFTEAAEPTFLYKHTTSTMEAVIALKRKRMSEAEWGALLAAKAPLLRVQMLFLLHPGATETMACVGRLMACGANAGMCDMYRVLSGGRMSELDNRDWVMTAAAMAVLRRESTVVSNHLFLREHQHFQCLQTLELANANLDMVTRLRDQGHMFDVAGFDREVTRLKMDCIAFATETNELKNRLAGLMRVYNKQKALRKRQNDEAKLRREAQRNELIRKCAEAPQGEPPQEPSAKRARHA